MRVLRVCLLLVVFLSSCTQLPTPSNTDNVKPVIKSFSATPSSGEAPLDVTFSWEISYKTEGKLTCYLDVNNDGKFEYTINFCNVNTRQSHTYKDPGEYVAKLKVSDGNNEDSKTLNIKVIKASNKPPVINEFGANPLKGKRPLTVTFSWKVYDPEGDFLVCQLDIDGDGRADYSILDCYNNTSQKHTYKVTGTYRVTLIVDDGKNIKKSEVVITVNEADTWAKFYDTSDKIFFRANASDITSDGGYIIAGYSINGDILILKLDKDGNVEWSKTYGGDQTDIALSIKQTSDRGYIVAGKSIIDMLVLKLDSLGNVEWQKVFNSDRIEVLSSVEETHDGGYIIAGNISNPGFYEDIVVLKLDSNGNLKWYKVYGGNYADVAVDIKKTSEGGYILAGYTFSFGAGASDIWILKLDGNGNIQWAKAYGGSGYDEPTSIQQTSDGGYIITGYTNSFNAPEYSVWVLKLDANGNIEWQKVYGDQFDDKGRYIVQTSDGGYIVAGTYNYDNILVIKLDQSGNLEWQKGYSLRVNCVPYIGETPNGGYIVTGCTNSSGWIALRIDNNGNINNCDILIYESQVQSQNTNVTPVNTNSSPGTVTIGLNTSYSLTVTDINVVSEDIYLCYP